jgi:uncharacterized repeat protein (TIGR04076 family)
VICFLHGSIFVIKKRVQGGTAFEGPCKDITFSWYFCKGFFVAMKKITDEFTLYDLRVEVVACRGKMICNHKIGDYFEVKGENLSLPDGQTFSLYSLAALLPLLPAKQRETNPNDWMTTDTDIACPDPNCGAIFRIIRTKKRSLRHSEVTAVPLKKND